MTSVRSVCVHTDRIGLQIMTKAALLIACFAVEATAVSGQQLAPSHTVATPPHPAAHEVARVNGVALMSDRLDAAVNTLIPLESFHRSVSDAKLAEFRQQALQQLVDEELEYQEGRRIGVTVTDRDVETALEATVARYGGRDTFGTALARSGASMSSVRAEIRRALIIARTRERRVTATCQVDQAEAARYFDQHPGRFEEPEQLHVYAITVGVDPSSPAQEWKAARAKAETLRGELAAGASFSELAEKHSTDPSRAQGGDMGWFHRGSLMPQFETVAKDLPLGRVSDVIDTLYGYHLIRVTEIRPARRLAFSEVSDRLAKDLTETRCKEVSDAWLGRLRSSATIVFPR